jgi:hypothetical protein
LNLSVLSLAAAKILDAGFSESRGIRQILYLRAATILRLHSFNTK